MLGVALAGVLAGAAAAQVVTNPDWARRPSAAEMSSYFPDEAVDKSISGRAVIRCVVPLSGRLEDCTVISEFPAGMGFGEAAVRMARREFLMKPALIDGKPVGGESVTIPLKFRAPTFSPRYVIEEAVWSAAPSFEDMVAAWPAAADGNAEIGTAVLRCRVGEGGSLRSCIIAGQVPKGSPFGEAAQTLVGKFRLKVTADELKKYGAADIAVSFRFYNPATPAGQAKKVEKPDWIVRINPERIVALYPAAAADAGVREGVGVADCLVAPDGKMTDCKVAGETPAGLGFGQSAVLALSLMQMDPWTPEGRPVAGARVRVPVKFSLAPEGEAEAPAAP
jgi:TonB family protein